MANSIAIILFLYVKLLNIFFRINTDTIDSRAEFPGLPIQVSLDNKASWHQYVPQMSVDPGATVVGLVTYVLLLFFFL